jgi:hypothetical protein
MVFYFVKLLGHQLISRVKGKTETPSAQTTHYARMESPLLFIQKEKYR